MIHVCLIFITESRLLLSVNLFSNVYENEDRLPFSMCRTVIMVLLLLQTHELSAAIVYCLAFC